MDIIDVLGKVMWCSFLLMITSMCLYFTIDCLKHIFKGNK